MNNNDIKTISYNCSRTLLLPCFLFAIALQTTASSAQEIDDLLGMDLSQLGRLQVTTASRHAERYSEVPGTLQVVTREQIRERGYRTLAELLADMAAVDVQTLSDGTSNNRIAMRGVVGNNKLLILQDGVRISSPTGDPIAVMDNFPLYHVRQVEVVYGAASALYGADAFTGVVNLITDMEPLAGGVATLEGGSFGHRYGDFNLVKSLGKDLRLQLGGHWRQDDNADLGEAYPESFPLADFRAGDSFSQPTDSQSLNTRLEWGNALSFGWTHSRYQSPTTIGAQPQAVLYSADANYTTLLDTLWGAWHGDLGEQLTSSVTVDWSRHEVDPASEFVNAFTDYQHIGYKYSRNERWRIDPQLTWKQQGHRLIGGLSLEWIDALPKTANLPHPYDQGGPFYYPNSDATLEIEIFKPHYRNQGSYLQYSGELGERTLLHLGARYDNNSEYGASFTPRAGINFTLAPGAVMKYLYSEAFLAPSPFFAYENYGSFNAGGPPYESGYFKVTNPDLQPERLNSHELRFVYTPSSDLEFNAGIYQLQADNIIYHADTDSIESGFVPGGTIFWTATNDNVGQINATGIDLGFDYTLHAEGWKTRLFGNASYMDGELSGIGATVPLPFVAYAKANLGFTWSHDKYQLTPKIRWVSAAQGPVDNGRRSTPGYTVADLYGRWLGLGQRSELFLRVDNLLDRRWYSVGDGGSSGLADSPQTPRRIILGVALGF
ncbi:MAG: TonB-dependent receptor [Gammaproteobacteria bacterium]|nr:TonB-dependent receptor [Gammaproteobacteria bacterium]